MLTKITIRKFKLFEEVEIPLENGVVFIGPNNSGKTSALQALSLWHAGLQKWADRHAPKDVSEIPTKRPGVPVNRLELISLPVAEMDLIWRDRKVRSAPNKNVRIDVIVEGVSGATAWKCGLEFDYDDSEGLFCRPLRLGSTGQRMSVSTEATKIQIAFLPSMSGLASEEALIREGRINVLIGQGQTAEVLRNLCYQVYQKDDKQDWDNLVSHIQNLFGVTLNPPAYLESRGTVLMDYQQSDQKIKLDLPSSGRGMQQVLLLLAYLYNNNPGTVLLLDEPDAHLEILRQREVYRLLIGVAEQRQAQIIAASHSEVLLNEAAQKKMVIAFVGKPHVLAEGKTNELLKSLNEVGFEYYYNAESKGWILYLESESDLSILKAFAIHLAHPAEEYLKAPLVKYLGNDRPNDASKHFHALREAKSDLVGMLLMDRLQLGSMKDEPGLKKMMWVQREIENYLCSKEALLSFAVNEVAFDDLVGAIEKEHRKKAMEKAIMDTEDAIRTLGKDEAFSSDIKASDDFLLPLFQNFSRNVSSRILEDPLHALRKKDFHVLVRHIPKNEVDSEIVEKLDMIVKTAKSAKPRTN